MRRGSTDDTRLIAQLGGAVVVEGGPERSRQCNTAASVATGAYIYRVDADFTLHPQVIADAVRACELDGFDAVAVPNTGAGSGFWERVRRLERDCYRGDKIVVAVRFLRTELFRTLGGYDVDLVAGEDYDLHNRVLAAGARWTEIEHGEEHWGEPRSLGEVARRSFYYGRSFMRYIRKYPGRAVKQINPMRGAYWRHRRTFVRHPCLSAGLVLLKLVEYSAAGAGLLRSVVDETVTEWSSTMTCGFGGGRSVHKNTVNRTAGTGCNG